MIRKNGRSGASEIRLGAPLPPHLQTGNDRLRGTQRFRVAFCRDTRPVGYYPQNPTGRITTLFATRMITRIPCNTCGAEILPATAEATGGVCMACKQGIRRGPVDRHGLPIENQAPTSKKEKVVVAPNGHIHITGEDGSYTHLNVSRMTGAEAFLHELENKKELRTKVTALILDGRAADIEKGDLEPLMRLWLTGAEAKRSGDTTSRFFFGPSFADEFKSLSTILTAAGLNLERFAAAAFSPGQPQESSSARDVPPKSYRHWILPLVLSGFLGLAIGIDDVDYSFFVVLRFAVCASFGWWAWRAHERGQSTWRNLFVLTAVFYNPFVPLQLDREWWQVANGLTIAITLVSAAKNKLDEQAGAGQPATRPESDSEGGGKPQTESKGRSW